ncbi:MAG: MBL fold metallo-hydrolase [Myxococcota bacterium]
MKLLHRADLFCWSRFDEGRNIDFHSLVWMRPAGNVVVDPLPLSDHERKRLEMLGGVRHIVVTNSDHVRATRELAAQTGARTYGPHAEREGFPITCDVWLSDGDEVVPGLVALALDGSKTPGELALLLEDTTLITGDLVRAHAAARLDLLPDAKLKDAALARRSLARLAALSGIEAVLPGDGWPVFRDGQRALSELAARVGATS